MAKKVFGSEIEPKCAYCAKCIKTKDNKTALCEKKGLTTPDGSCRKFVYDPMKRVPSASHPPLPEYSKAAFSLDPEVDS